MPWHTHQGVHELLLGLRGTFSHRIDDQHFTQSAGELVLVESKSFHELRGTNCAWMNIALRPEWFTALAMLYGEPFARLRSTPSRIPEPYFTSVLPSTDRRQRDVASPAGMEPGWRSTPEGVRRWLCAALEATFREAAHATAAEPWWLRNTLRKLDTLAPDELSVTRLPALAGRSREHVSRAFRRYLGCTPSTHLNRLRIRHATQLLETTSLSITDIALESGFESLNHFFLTFRRTHGCSPKQYRSQVPLMS